MNPYSTPSPRRTLVKRWLPYLLLAALIINSSLLLLPIDIVIIFIASVADLVNIDTSLAPVSQDDPIVGILRIGGNIILVIMVIAVAFRSLQEKKA